MAVIGRRLPFGVLALSALPLLVKPADDPRARIGQVAQSLSAGDAAAAIEPFDRSFTNYDKLRTYFQALAGSFQLDNEIDVTDEQDTSTEAKLSINWSITLKDLGTGATERRSEDVSVRFQLKSGKWEIVDFSPIELFNPQQKHTGRE